MKTKKIPIYQLSSYLPYEVKAIFNENENKYCRKKIIGTVGCVYASNSSIVCHDVPNATPTKFKLILRPLSDLTKSIIVDGKEFIPIIEIAIYSPSQHGVAYLIEQIKLGLVEIIVFNMLLKWNFDVFGLIEQDLAVDINKIKNYGNI